MLVALGIMAASSALLAVIKIFRGTWKSFIAFYVLWGVFPIIIDYVGNYMDFTRTFLGMAVLIITAVIIGICYCVNLKKRGKRKILIIIEHIALCFNLLFMAIEVLIESIRTIVLFIKLVF